MRNIYFLILISLFCQTGMAQRASDFNSQFNLPKLVPVSPNAASLGKYGDVPVGYYTGVPSISIPLFTITEGDIQLPISLDYHAGGIKVEEMPSWAGLGWALNSGGVISRSARGLEDESANGFKYQGVNARRNYFNQMDDEEAFLYLRNIYNQAIDSEADLFSFSIGSLQGKFFFTNDGKIVTMPRSDIEVKLTSNNAWEIIDGKGIHYFFGNSEITTTEPFCKSNNSGYSNNDMFNAISAWNITRIVDSKGNEVNFNYGPGGLNFRTKSMGTYNLSQSGLSPSCPPEFSECYNVNSINSGTLNEITFSSGKIKFELQTGSALDNVAPLSRILLSDKNNNTIKGFQFHTSYFQTSNIGGCEDGINKRLRLDSLSELDRNQQLKRPHKFEYNLTPLPCRLSNAQDYWGFYNGKPNETFVRYQNVVGGPWLGANKDPDESFAKASILEKVTYPTGGSTAFEFEGNTYAFGVYGFDFDDPQTIMGLRGDNSNSSGNPSLTFQTSFQINSSDIGLPGYAVVKADIAKFCADPSVYNVISCRVYNAGGYNRVINNGDTLQLSAGNYTFEGFIETEFAGIPYTEFTAAIKKIPYKNGEQSNLPYGGIRVKSIRNFNEQNEIADVQEVSYNSFGSTFSSGVYQHIPDYNYQKVLNVVLPGCTYIAYNSVSNYPLLMASGRPMGYSNVTVYYGPGRKNGKKEMEYTTYSNYPDSVDFSFPFPPANAREWRRGLLTKEVTYSFDSLTNSYGPIQSKSINYSFHSTDSTKKSAFSIRLGKRVVTQGWDNNKDYFYWGLERRGYLTTAEAFNISSDTVTIYSLENPARTSRIATEYEYTRNNFQLRQTTSTDSKGDVSTSVVSYPLDYTTTSSSVGTAAALFNLKNIHAVSIPVEQYVIKTSANGQQHVIAGLITTFKSNLAVADSIFGLEIVKPLPLLSFTPSFINAQGKFVRSSFYQPRLHYASYSPSGKILEQRKVGDVARSYLWGYNDNYAIAEILNAPRSAIACTSFEDFSDGGWTISSSIRVSDGLTGQKSYDLSNGAVSRSNLPSDKIYKVSYWSTGGPVNVNGTTASAGISHQGWTCYKHVLPASTTQVIVQGAVKIDELRLHPLDAQVTSYTHSPGVGMTSVTDSNNTINYYEYDSFGRLWLMRDFDRNILKKYTYNYRQ